MNRIKVKTSKHAKVRYRERYGEAKGFDIQNDFLNAVKRGKSPRQFDEPFRSFLISKERKKKATIKVHRGRIYIYKWSKLITVYDVPDNYKIYLLERSTPSDEIVEKYNKLRKEVKVLGQDIYVMNNLLQQELPECMKEGIKENRQIAIDQIKQKKEEIKLIHNQYTL